MNDSRGFKKIRTVFNSQRNKSFEKLREFFNELPESPALSTFEGEAIEEDPFIQYYRDRFSNQHDTSETSDMISLDSFFEGGLSSDSGFLKIDTDGHELSVLKSSEKLLQSRFILGVEIECQFHGPAFGFDGCFSEIDKFLRKFGFSLFKLDPVYYSRAVLPSKFLYDGLPAQNVTGQIQWADALYLRDLSDPSYPEKFSFEASPEQLLSLALIYDLYGLSDCAAEIVLKNHRLNLDDKTSLALLNFLSDKLGFGPDYLKAINDWLKRPL